MKRKTPIFISYRRESGSELARLVRDGLRERGFEVFMDVEDLKSGPFDERLLGLIDSATDVVVILTPGCMDRCFQDGDWLRWEVAHALASGKNVVPVKARDFNWPTRALPDDIQRLPYQQGIEPSHDLFEASLNKLAKLLKARRSILPLPRRKLFAALIILVIALLIFAGVLLQYERSLAKQNFELGRSLCFKEQRWQSGIVLLAKYGGQLKDAASAELECPAMFKEVDVARLWLAAADQVAVPDKWHCYNRARHWFREALTNSAPSAEMAATIKQEMERVPTLRAGMRLKGQTPWWETVLLVPDKLTWVTRSGVGPFEISSPITNLPTFTFEGNTRNMCSFKLSDLLPEGVDITTARIRNSRFGGNTGSLAKCALEQGVRDGVEFVRIQIKDDKDFEGGFTFDITVSFGE